MIPFVNNTTYTPVFQLTRGRIVESVHFGAIAVVDSQGNLISWAGDPYTVMFLRSSAKPFQVLPFLEAGGQTEFHLTPQEIAMMCASHSGMDEHVYVIRNIQQKTGVSESELLCGVHLPYHKPTADVLQQRGEMPTPNRHNCSGKHTGMLAFSRMLHKTDQISNLPYIHPDHPVQSAIKTEFAEMCGLPVDQIESGIDGCSAPNFAVPLYNAAFAFARLCDPQQLGGARVQACQTVTAAMTTYPEMIGGPDSFDTLLMQATQGRMVVKGGAEGYQGVGLLPGCCGPGSPGIGIVFKISDGDLKGHNRPVGDPRGHVRPAVALEILRQLGAISASELDGLVEFGPIFAVKNWRQIDVGRASPCFSLEFAPEFIGKFPFEG